MLDSWHEWRTIFDLAHLVIMRRPESRLAWSGELQDSDASAAWSMTRSNSGKKPGLVLPLEVTQLAISSTGIRNQLLAGQSPRFLLPDTGH